MTRQEGLLLGLCSPPGGTRGMTIRNSHTQPEHPLHSLETEEEGAVQEYMAMAL